MATKFTPLSEGAIESIIKGEHVECPVILQILGSRRIANAGQGPDPKDRYRLLVSDGKCIHTFAMLSTNLNDMFESGDLSDYSIIQINRYVTSIVNKNESNERRVVILFEIDVLHPGNIVNQKIGNPEIQDMKASKPAETTQKTQKENIYSNSNTSKSNGNSYQKQNDQNRSMNQTSTNLEEHLTLPIKNLSPYQNKWVIKARVTSKSNIRTWSNAKGEGKLFSMDLMDESGEIRATAFKDQVDTFYDMIQVDKVYYISKCQLKPANKQYSNIKNDYEMTFNSDTIIQECMETSSIPEVKYDFVSIAEIADKEPNSIVDVIGVCRDASEISQITARSTGRELTKRDVTLIDSSNTSISLTLWGEDAKNFSADHNPVVLLKGGRITEFGGGKQLGMVGGSQLKINPDIPEGHRLRGWIDNGGAANVSSTLSTRTTGNISTEWMTFHQTKLKNLGSGDKPDYFQTVAYIHNIKSNNAFYKACPQTDCNKKVIDQDNGTFRCEKCNMDFPNFKYRLLVNMLIGDWTSNRWVTVFSETAEQLLGKTSQEVGEMLEHDMENANAVFSSVTFKNKVFKLRTKIETYGDVPRNKITTISISDIDYPTYNEYLIQNLKQITGIGKAHE